MHKKTIIGLIGNKEGRDIVANILYSNGFYKISIEDKVKSVSNLMEIAQDLNLVRERGYKVGKMYWINLTLSMVPDDKELIVIDDLRLEDIVDKLMKVYLISEDKDVEVPKHIELIYKDKDIEKFKDLVNKKFKH